ncbi:hypothetical protein FACS1894172_14970 [Spirochaetia bacterium]|nr:hypothetical protein FACS1894172_14970 [Spirochaetia bacterium]
MKIPEKFVSRLLMSIFGDLVIALGCAFIRFSDFGTDPYTSMNLGIKDALGMSLGVWQLLMNCVVIIWVFFADRRKINIGTIFNMAGIGFMSDFLLYYIIEPLFGIEGTLLIRIIALIFSVLAIAVGLVLYVDADLGIAPYDAIAVIISEKLKKPQRYRWYRMATDFVCVIISFIFKGPLGIGTLFVAFCTGPLAALLRNLFYGRKIPH